MMDAAGGAGAGWDIVTGKPLELGGSAVRAGASDTAPTATNEPDQPNQVLLGRPQLAGGNQIARVSIRHRALQDVVMRLAALRASADVRIRRGMLVRRVVSPRICDRR